MAVYGDTSGTLSGTTGAPPNRVGAAQRDSAAGAHTRLAGSVVVRVPKGSEPQNSTRTLP